MSKISCHEPGMLHPKFSCWQPEEHIALTSAMPTGIVGLVVTTMFYVVSGFVMSNSESPCFALYVMLLLTQDKPTYLLSSWLWENHNKSLKFSLMDRLKPSTYILMAVIPYVMSLYLLHFVCLVGFLRSLSTTRLYRGRAPRQSVWQF